MDPPSRLYEMAPRGAACYWLVNFILALYLSLSSLPNHSHYTDKKENQIFFFVYKEIQSGAVAKSYMRKGASQYMMKCANI